MQTRFLPAPALAAVLALVATLAGAATASATKYADLRVVATNGTTLAEFRQYTGGRRIPTDRRAECFGEGTGGSGDSFRIGASPITALADASSSERDLRPLSITDYYLDSFGPGLCGISGMQTRGNRFWETKVDHADSQVGPGEPLDGGEDVLFYRTPTFPPPPELVLRAPASADPGAPYQVTVTAHSDAGESEPAQGAMVDGAAAPADAQGHALVTSPPGTASLQATRGDDIPSNLERVCVEADAGACPAAEGIVAFGRDAEDSIRGTAGNDRIVAGGGDDRIEISSGGADRVRCGAGRDVVIRDPGDGAPDDLVDCERKRRP